MTSFTRIALAGGVVVFVLIVAAIVFWPDDDGAAADDTSSLPTSTATPQSTATPAPPAATATEPPPTATPTPSPLPPQAFSDIFDSSSTTVGDLQVQPNGLLQEVVLDEDGVKHLIPPDLIEGGGVGRDGIPSIDAPHFVGPDRWAQMAYQDDWLVVGVDINGAQRAYPLRILVWHEVVNDTLDGVPLLVSF